MNVVPRCWHFWHRIPPIFYLLLCSVKRAWWPHDLLRPPRTATWLGVLLACCWLFGQQVGFSQENRTHQPPTATRPNVILFLVDDLGVMDTSVPFLTDTAGKPKKYALNEYYRTPQLDA